MQSSVVPMQESTATLDLDPMNCLSLHLIARTISFKISIFAILMVQGYNKLEILFAGQSTPLMKQKILPPSKIHGKCPSRPYQISNEQPNISFRQKSCLNDNYIDNDNELTTISNQLVNQSLITKQAIIRSLTSYDCNHG